METENVGCRHHGGGVVKVVGIIVLGIIILGAVFQKNFLPTENTISVSGQGKVPVKFDGAVINLGVVTLKAATPEDALNQTNAKIEKIKGIFAEMQIPETDWQVTAYAFDPQFKSVPGEGENANSSTSVLDGYNDFQRITVKLNGIDKDPKMVDNFIQRMVKEGVNKVGAVKFVASNIDELKQSAREKSMQAAKAKAITYQKTMGVKLEGISGISESEVAVPPSTQYYYDNDPITFNGTSDQVTVNQTINYQAEVIIETTVDYRVK